MHLPWESVPRGRCIFFYVCRFLFYSNYSLLFQHFNQCLNIGQSPGKLHVVFPDQAICQRFILYSRAAFLQLFNKVSRRVVEHKHFREVNLFAVTYKHLFILYGLNEKGCSFIYSLSSAFFDISVLISFEYHFCVGQSKVAYTSSA